jgi:chemotaxis protein MotA
MYPKFFHKKSVCFPLSTYLTLVKVFFQKILGRYASKHETVIAEIVGLSKGYRDNPNYLNEQSKLLKNDFLREAIGMMVEGGIPPESLDSILRKRALTHYKRYEEEAGIFKTIGKFPPAFGLMGTTLGMIALLQKLGSPDSYKLLGPSMAIGLVATLYGIAITNFIFVPMGENLSKLNKEDEVLREMVMDGVKLIRKKEHPLVV